MEDANKYEYRKGKSMKVNPSVHDISSFKKKFTQKYKFGHYHSTSRRWKVGCSFVVRKNNFWSFTAKQRNSILYQPIGETGVS